MTFLKKAMEIDGIKGKQRTRTEIIQGSCPSEYGLEPIEKSDNCTVSKVNDCQKCWNREMPSTEPTLSKDDYIHIGEVHGMNEVWEFMKKLHELTHKEVMDIYGNSSSRVILDKHTPQEAIAKLKAYEEAQEIKVGDVVTNEERNVEILVTEIDDYERTFNGIKVTPTDELGNLGGVYTVMLMCKFKKTGKHIDIQSILEQIN